MLDSHHLKSKVALQGLNVNELQEENNALMIEINALKNDPNAVEAQARRRLGMIKKGEVFYQIIDRSPTSYPQSSPSNE